MKREPRRRRRPALQLVFIQDLTEYHHLLFSAGRSIVGANLLQNYAAYQLTL